MIVRFLNQYLLILIGILLTSSCREKKQNSDKYPQKNISIDTLITQDSVIITKQIKSPDSSSLKNTCTKQFYSKNHILFLEKYFEANILIRESEWYPNGNIKKEIKFYYNQYKKSEKRWDENGKPNNFCIYEKKSGRTKKQVFYYPNGKIRQKIQYKDDGKLGKLEIYDENGNLTDQGTYDPITKSNKIYRAVDLPNQGTVTMIEYWQEDELIKGEYYLNGKLKKTTELNKEEKIAVIKEYENHKTIKISYYQSSTLNAYNILSNYDLEDRLFKVESLKNGKIINTQHYKNGKLIEK